MSREIGFLLHPGEQGAIKAAVACVEANGYTAWSVVDDPEAAIVEHAATTDLLVTVGGDGTFLYGARLAAPLDIPVLGVNRGRLGFLTEVEVPVLPRAIDDFAAGRAVLQRRAMIAVALDGAASPAATLALNDVAMKSHGVSVVRLHVDADEEVLGEFDADGIVIATATGSTAYALSAGGPPIDPRVPALVVVPLAPHAVITRPVVLPEMTRLRVTVQHGTVFAAADGQELGVLHEGAHVNVSPGPELSMVRFPHSPTFLGRLRDKVRFGLPLKPLTREPGESDSAEMEAHG